MSKLDEALDNLLYRLHEMRLHLDEFQGELCAARDSLTIFNISYHDLQSAHSILDKALNRAEEKAREILETLEREP